MATQRLREADNLPQMHADKVFFGRGWREVGMIPVGVEDTMEGGVGEAIEAICKGVDNSVVSSR